MQNFSRVAVATVIAGAVVAGVVPAMQPMLLGGLAAAGRINAVQIGQAAMFEAIGMGLSTLLAGILLQPRRLRTIAALAAIGSALCNGATIMLSAEWLILARFLSGICSGMLLWLFISLTVRVALPARLSAIYVTAQATGALVLATAYVALVAPVWGVNGGYGVLALMNVLMAVLAPLVPRQLEPLPVSAAAAAHRRFPGLSGWVGLLAVACHIAGIMALWVYAKPLALQFGMSDAATDLALSLAIAAQIGGGLAAIALARRLPFAIALGASLVISAVAVAALPFGGSVAFVALMLVGFFWMFAPPFQMPFMLASDPPGRAVILVGTAQLSGVAAGPAMAAAVVSQAGPVGAQMVSVAFFTMALLAGVTALFLAHRERVVGRLTTPHVLL